MGGVPNDKNIMQVDDDTQLIFLQWSYCERYKYIGVCVFMHVCMYVCVCTYMCKHLYCVCTCMCVRVCVRCANFVQ